MLRKYTMFTWLYFLEALISQITSNYALHHHILFSFFEAIFSPNTSDLVKTKEVGIMCMSKKTGVRNIHKNSVVFLQLQGGAQVALCCPRVFEPLGAETCSVGLHQRHRRGTRSSPQKHRVDKRGCRGTVSKGQFHPCVNVVESRLVDLQSPILKPVGHAAGYEGPAPLRLPSQCPEFFLFNAPWKRMDTRLLLWAVRWIENHRGGYIYIF